MHDFQWKAEEKQVTDISSSEAPSHQRQRAGMAC